MDKACAAARAAERPTVDGLAEACSAIPGKARAEHGELAPQDLRIASGAIVIASTSTSVRV